MSGNRRKFAILILAMLGLLSSCKRKPKVPQPQSQAPTITRSEPRVSPQPPPQPEPLPRTRPPLEPTTPPSETPATTTAPKPKTRRRHVAKKPATPIEKGKTAEKESGDIPAGGQLSAGISENEATRQRESAAQLRASTEKDLQSITWQLSSDEQSMVQQIRAYVAQSRSADESGDIERAYNLAVKAHLLSGELAKR